MAYIGKAPTPVPLTTLDIADGAVDTADLADGAVTEAKITGLTSTFAELNALDGLTADVNELNTLDGITADVNELNQLDGFGDIGFRNIPAVGAKTSSYTLTVSDVGKFVEIGSGGSITIPNSTFSAGDVIVLYNNTTGDRTVTCSISTAYIGGVNADESSVTIATRGICNILFISGTVAVLTGNIS